jgi:plasmid stabilization system protein ParE
MARLIWTARALSDLSRLHRFLAPKNRDAARRATRTIRDGAKTLATHPEIGRPMDEMPPEFREWLIPFGAGGYLVLYRYDGTLVAILAVRHAREAGY